GPQVPNVRAGRFVGRYDQARAIGGKSRRPYVVLVWAFQPGQRAAGLEFDQPRDLAGVLDDPKPAVGREAATPNRPHLAPAPDLPQPLRGQQPFPVGAKADSRPSIDGQLGHFGTVRESPDRHATIQVVAGRQPLAIGADRYAPAVIQRPDLDRPVAQCHAYLAVSSHGDDLARSVLRHRAIRSRQVQASGWSDPSLATRHIDMNR